MDRISGLPDELLEKILSFVPTQVAVSTSILSKRWKFLWMSLPKLEYDDTCNRYPESALEEFIDKNLPLHRAPVIESLSLHFGGDSNVEPEDIKRWVEIAVSRNVRELDISYSHSEKEIIFPSSFYTCKSLVVLKLRYVTLMDVPSTACLPSLKTLKLESVTHPNQESLQQLLSVCPVLEELSMHFDGDHDGVFTVIVPSLQRLSLYIAHDLFLEGYEIETPSLKYLKLDDQNIMEHESDITNMPKLNEAYVDLVSHDLKSVIGTVTSVKRLTICSPYRGAG
ncbi:FBD-associated F-box protein At5g38590 isoform X2 [Eutrema salsugineum]|uniref:FBD-associated F-box protein At5g38590 isoform X2 n=1 Tax=Eutrema salsugineum TaxID=72664 RepID=UPI000CED7AB1|nr:FBD-associated F-box protein At5g38590 isoform X2 [Eutrema salsugineum]